MSKKVKKMNFSKIQSEILNSRENLIVSAGAGSGKTRVLVEKYLKVFEENPQMKIDQVVAITFTEKATQEMKSRILQRLNERIKKSDE
jgi:ATP-dependent helicase/nuclease subunit A